MKAVETAKIIFSKKIICQFIGHKMITTKNVTEHIREYRCTFCKLEQTNIEDGQITFLTPELKDINETIIDFHKKRKLRLQHI